ncbi:amidohydrolase family protein [Nonomuraea sp. NPDC048916]|uniref:dihydroorotase n=1 Tax=Nonomuraea sp. NPDC048916 TaxID=3154232 RepID=UPI00340DE2C5
MEKLDLLITGARTATHDSRLRNIGVRDGRIVAFADASEDLGDAPVVVDAAGRWVIPGAIDTHSHIGQLASEYADLPGFSRDENYAFETRGAVAGGVTTALNYVKFGQGSLVEAYHDGVGAARRESRMDILFHGYVMNEDQLLEVPEAAAAGMRTFKMFMPYRGSEARDLGGIGSLNHAQMRRAFESIAAHGGQALVHAEDGDIVEHCMHQEIAQGMPTLASYERGRPVQAEGDAAWTALYLAEHARCPVTIVHVSSLEAIRVRRASGYPWAALESCPHYAVLNTASPIGAQGKVAPPLRSPELAAAISDAVMAGEIDFFGSDHNVWPAAAKTDLIGGRAGLPGIGLMLPLILTHFVHERGMSMERAIELTSTNAARRFDLPRKGWLGVGADADIVVLDTGERTVRAAELFSAVDFSPYEGLTLRSWPHTTICGGRLVYQDGEMVADDHRGTVLNEARGANPA